MAVADICGGLEHLHRQTPPIAYRALTIETVVLGADGHWKLSDFRLCTTRSKVLLSKEDMETEKAEVSMIDKSYRAPELDNLFSRELIDTKVPGPKTARAVSSAPSQLFTRNRTHLNPPFSTG